MLEGRVLVLQLDGRVIAPTDFQHKAAPVAVNSVVEVLPAAEGLQRPTEAVMLLK